MKRKVYENMDMILIINNDIYCTQGCCFFFRRHAGETLQVDSLPLCVCSFRSNLAGPSPFSIHAHMAGQGDFWNHMVLFPHLLFKFQTFTYTLHDPPSRTKVSWGLTPSGVIRGSVFPSMQLLLVELLMSVVGLVRRIYICEQQKCSPICHGAVFSPWAHIQQSRPLLRPVATNSIWILNDQCQNSSQIDRKFGGMQIHWLAK